MPETLQVSCPEKHCEFPRVPCVRGEAPENCPALKGVVVREDPTTVRPRNDLPWTGAALGAADLSLITAFTRPRIVVLVGLENAGKTSILAALYLLLGRGYDLPGRTFAGSLTLQGWEAIAAGMRLPPFGSGSGFPDHTTSTDRQPGLLHLAFRLDDGRREEILFADAPGEWFREWADNADAEAAEGARWLVRHGDSLALLLDSEALAGKGRGRYRAQQLRLVRRTADQVGEKLVVPVWAKADVEVPTTMREQINEQLARSFPGKTSVLNTARPGVWTPDAARSFLGLFQSLLASTPAHFGSPVVPTLEFADPLLAFRGHSADR